MVALAVKILLVQDHAQDKGKPEQYLCYLLHAIGVSREDAVVCRLEDMLQYEADVVVPLGAEVSARLLPSSKPFDMLHGIPVSVDGVSYLPMYHYASGVNNRRMMSFIQDDFKVLQRLLEGSVELPIDTYTEEYKEVTDVQEAKELLSQPKFALDTETIFDPEPRLWSIQVSSKPGTGSFIPIIVFGHGASVLSLNGIFHIPETSKVIVHNYLYDAQFLDLPNPIDTMVMAYLLQMPMGLKELAYRLCGMEMHSYEEYVLPYRRSKALAYIDEALCFTHTELVPKNPKAAKPSKFVERIAGYADVVLKDWQWDNKQGELVEHERKPKNIAKKLLALRDKDDPYTEWNRIDSRERVAVESILGPMLDTDLRDAPAEAAVYYSTRDADATLRVALKLWPMLAEAGLMPTFEMEMGR